MYLIYLRFSVDQSDYSILCRKVQLFFRLRWLRKKKTWNRPINMSNIYLFSLILTKKAISCGYETAGAENEGTAFTISLVTGCYRHSHS